MSWLFGFCFGLCLVTLVGASPEVPQAPSALDTLLAQTDRSRGGAIEGATWSVHVEARKSDVVTMERDLDVQVRTREGHQAALLTFTAPAKVNGHKMLLRDHNMWFAKPGLSKAVPISPRQRLTGAASNADVASSNYALDYTVTLLRDEVYDGRPCKVLQLDARNQQVTYRRIVYWVDEERLVGLRADFFSTSGRLFKTATFTYGHTLEVDGQPLPFVSRVTIVDAIQPDEVTTLDMRTPHVAAVSEHRFNVATLTH